MIRLGEAVGFAAGLALRDGKTLREIPVNELQTLMKFRNETEDCLKYRSEK